MLKQKRDMLDAILYLFDKHISAYTKFTANEAVLADELEEHGYPLNTIDRTVAWVSNIPKLKRHLESLALRDNTLRIFSAEEGKIISAPIRAYIAQLEKSGFITTTEREIIISCIMQIDKTDELELSQIKRVIVMVLFNLSDKYNALLAYEHILNDDNKSIN